MLHYQSSSVCEHKYHKTFSHPSVHRLTAVGSPVPQHLAVIRTMNCALWFVESCVAERLACVLSNASLGDFVLVRKYTYTSLDGTVLPCLLHT